MLDSTRGHHPQKKLMFALWGDLKICPQNFEIQKMGFCLFLVRNEPFSQHFIFPSESTEKIEGICYF